MLYLSENLKKYRMMKNLTQEDVADYLNIISNPLFGYKTDFHIVISTMFNIIK